MWYTDLNIRIKGRTDAVFTIDIQIQWGMKYVMNVCSAVPNWRESQRQDTVFALSLGHMNSMTEIENHLKTIFQKLINWLKTYPKP